MPGEVQANLGATLVKAARPVDRLRCLEIVPLKTDAQFAEAAVELPPARADGTPRRCFFAGQGGGFGYDWWANGHLQRAQRSAKRFDISSDSCFRAVCFARLTDSVWGKFGGDNLIS
jgi:hypothetical protein